MSPFAQSTVDLRTTPFHRPCWAEISRQALQFNWRSLRTRLTPNVQMLAVVKANAYGHGLDAVSRVATAEGAVILGVSSLDEGLQVRAAGIETPVLILGSIYPFDGFPLLFEHRLTPTVASVEAADALNSLAARKGARLAVHLKIDSGFGRIGVSPANAIGFIQHVAAKPGLVIEGLYTHFASADVDPDYTRQQKEAFESVVKSAAAKGVRPKWIHMANTSALLRYPDTYGTLVRPGLGFYGIPPYSGAEKEAALSPALSWKTRIIFLKTVAAGARVSYAGTWTAKRATRVATLAVGYADGFPRQLSNKGQVLIGGQKAPVIGRVTMDMTMVDATDISDCHVGDEVVLIGTQGSEHITAGDLAATVDTNAYDILCGIAPRVTRVLLP